MKKAPKHKDEAQRLDALESLHLLDTLPEKEFDEITLIASHICDTPIALISLVDRDRQWFKSKIGITASETSRDTSFCAHAILEGDIFEVPDSTKDERFANNPLVVNAPNAVFYAGAQIHSPDGFPIGTICVIDNKPRTLTDGQKRSLTALSNQVDLILKLKNAERIIAIKAEKLSLLIEGIPAMIGHWGSDLLNINANKVYLEYFGQLPSEIKGKHMKEVLGEKLFTLNLPYIEGVLSGTPQTFEREIRQPNGSRKVTLANYIPIFNGTRVDSFLVCVTDLSEAKKLDTERRNLEAQLSESARLSTLGEMAGGVAHEINTPLAIIRGKAGFLKRVIADGKYEAATAIEGLKTIENTVDRIAKVIRGLRTYSRDAKEDPFVPVHMATILEDTISLCAELLLQIVVRAFPLLW